MKMHSECNPQSFAGGSASGLEIEPRIPYISRSLRLMGGS